MRTWRATSAKVANLLPRMNESGKYVGTDLKVPSQGAPNLKVANSNIPDLGC